PRRAVPYKGAARHQLREALIQRVGVARPRRGGRGRLTRGTILEAYCFTVSKPPMCRLSAWFTRSPTWPSVLKPCSSLLANDFTRVPLAYRGTESAVT